MQLYSKWAVVRTPDAAVVQSIADKLGVSSVTASLLAARGYKTPAAARAFLDAGLSDLHDPSLLPDLEEAVARIGRALDEGEQIGIYGDYDVDGQTSTALLVRGLRDLGAAPRWYIPERVAEGYGLNRQAIEKLADEGVKLLITVDCGSGAANETTRARELGMDVIISDHHEPGEEEPPAAAFVNPKRPGCAYPFRELAGVGVAWKLMQALWQARGRQGFSPHSLEYAALGTVADVCPLVDENRAFVRAGLALINGDAMPALRALSEVSDVKRGEVSATRIAFGLAPRLNAAGRVGHAELGVRLLLSDDYDEAVALARELDAENRRRREIEAEIVEQAIAVVEQRDMLSDWVLVVEGEGWHPGVIGIVASRLVERYARPAVVIGLHGDVGTGSARSSDAFDLHAGLTACNDMLIRYGGHQMAAGLTVRRDDVDALRRMLNQYADTVLSPTDLVPKTRVDGKVSLAQITESLARELEQLAPFGAGNPTPVLAAEDVLVVGARTVGQQADHLKLTLKDKEGDRIHEGMAFGGGALLDAITPGSIVHVAFALRLGEWRGAPQLTLALRALQSPLSAAERMAALDGEPMPIVVAPVSEVRGRPVPIADRRRRAAAHPLARAAYLAPLSHTGARVVAVIGPGEDGADLAGSIRHSLRVEARIAEDAIASPTSRVTVIAASLANLGARNRAGFDVGAAARGNPSAGAYGSGWTGRGHLVLFGLPILPETLWTLLLQAAVAPGWTVHLAYDTVGVQTSSQALARRYPQQETLRVLYRTLQTRAGKVGGTLPSARLITSFIEAERAGLIDQGGVEHGLGVFEQLGLIETRPAGRRLVPLGGRKVDVASSELYNVGIKIQEKFAAFSRIALEASPVALLALAAERSPLDEFAIPDPGSSGFSQAGR